MSGSVLLSKSEGFHSLPFPSVTINKTAPIAELLPSSLDVRTKEEERGLRHRRLVSIKYASRKVNESVFFSLVGGNVHIDTLIDRWR